MIQEINAGTQNVPEDTLRAELEQTHGQVWNTRELTRDFEVIGFLAPLVTVTRKSDNQRGSLKFTNQPRYYFAFQPYTTRRFGPARSLRGTG